MPNKLIVALDVEDEKKALALVKTLRPAVDFFKVGLQLFTAAGPRVIEAINETGAAVFLDLKLFDIPNTVLKAIESGQRLGVSAMTLHALCGPETLKKASQISPRPKLWGVTVLTSFDDAALRHIGINLPVKEQVGNLARMSKECGLNGVICSPLEIGLVRETAGKGFEIVTPGVRSGVSADDQKRTLSAAGAVKAGADYLVVGRPILEAPSPREAAESILKEMNIN